MSNIIRKTTTREVVARCILDGNGNKRIVAYILDATIYCAIPRDMYQAAKPTDTYIGCVDLVKKMLPNPRYIGKIKMSKNNPGVSNNTKRGVVVQSDRLDVDRFLYKVKTDLFDQGYLPDDRIWIDRVDDATALYNCINGTCWTKSKDYNTWVKRREKLNAQ